MTANTVAYNYSLDTSQLLLNLSQDLAFQYNFTSSVLSLSPSVNNFIGLPAEHNTSLDINQYLPENWKAKALEIFNFYKDLHKNGVSLNGNANHILENDLEIYDKNHYRKWVNILSKPMIDRDKKCIGFYAFARDITYEKLLTQQFEYQQGLLNEIKSLQEARTRLISTLNHEFRTPLAIVRSNLQMIRRQKSKPQSRFSIDDSLELIETASERMMQMLDKLAVLSKGGKGKLTSEPEYINIVSFCEILTAELNSVKENGSRIDFVSDLSETIILTDAYLLEHILSNILINALKYSRAPSRVWFNLSRNGKGHIELNIRDEGIGIPEEDLDNIFEEFYRASNVGNIKGNGLGFALVKQCLNALNGKISVQSQLNKGTLVKITLPHQDLNEKNSDHRKRSRTRKNVAECS
jgi:signal transduction histidine kinase